MKSKFLSETSYISGGSADAVADEKPMLSDRKPRSKLPKNYVNKKGEVRNSRANR